MQTAWEVVQCVGTASKQWLSQVCHIRTVSVLRLSQINHLRTDDCQETLNYIDLEIKIQCVLESRVNF